MDKNKKRFDELVFSLTSPDATERVVGLCGLAELGNGAITALPKVKELVADDHSIVAIEAVGTALKIDQSCIDEMLPMLIAALTDKQSFVRAAAAEILGEQRAAARSALPLLHFAAELNDSVACSASLAVGHITGDYSEAIVVGVRLLDSRRWLKRVMGAEHLRLLGPIARPAIPFLELALEDRKKAVRKEARAAIEEIEGDGRV